MADYPRGNADPLAPSSAAGALDALTPRDDVADAAADAALRLSDTFEIYDPESCRDCFVFVGTITRSTYDVYNRTITGRLVRTDWFVLKALLIRLVGEVAVNLFVGRSQPAPAGQPFAGEAVWLHRYEAVRLYAAYLRR